MLVSEPAGYASASFASNASPIFVRFGLPAGLPDSPFLKRLPTLFPRANWPFCRLLPVCFFAFSAIVLKISKPSWLFIPPPHQRQRDNPDRYGQFNRQEGQNERRGEAGGNGL